MTVSDHNCTGMSNVEVRVRFFGKARELVACEEARATFPTSPLPYSELKEIIFHKLFVGLGPIEEACIIAVDQSYITDTDVVRLSGSSELAIIPPLSGG